VLGAAAGAAATWIMGMATSVMYERENPVARKREDDVRGGRQASSVAAQKAAKALGRSLTAAQSETFGNGIHWALGIGVGALYGALRHRMPALASGLGSLFGTAFFLTIDEAANTALRLTPPPTRFPWQAHARGLAGHLVYGLVAESVLRASDRWASGAI
jgi:hypothetical protein